MRLLHDIVYEISDREGVEPLDLAPIFGEVDEEVLEVLTDSSEYLPGSSAPFLKFVCYGYSVEIDGSGDVSISELASETTLSSNPDSDSDSSREAITAKIERRESALKNVSDIIAARERPFRRRLDGLLEVVRKTLGLDSATLSYATTDTYVFEAVDVADEVEIHAGDIIPLGETVCKRVIETEQALVLRDVEVEAPELANSACGVSSYLGVPVLVDGEVYGTFCFYDEASRDEEFSEWDLGFVELVSKWVSSELERRRRDRALHAATTERPYAAPESSTDGC